MIYVFTCSDLNRARVVTSESQALDLLKEAKLSFCWLEIYEPYSYLKAEAFTSLEKVVEKVDELYQFLRSQRPEDSEQLYHSFRNTIDALLGLEIGDGPASGLGAEGISSLLCISKGPGMVIAPELEQLLSGE